MVPKGTPHIGPNLPPGARSGFDAAMLRILRRRRPDLRWRIADDETDAKVKRFTTAADDDRAEPAARKLSEL
jgi:hypothetical protein